MLDQVKLCRECRYQRFIRDKRVTGCAIAPEQTLREAREQCGGLQWAEKTRLPQYQA